MTAKFVPRILHSLNRRTRFKLFYEMRVPDKWLDYCRIGDQMNNLPFICFKTPLSEKFSCKSNPYSLHQDEEFTPIQLHDEVEKRNIRLGMVIDLTNTYRYYNGKAEFYERFGIQYTKIKFDGYNPACFTAVYNIFSRHVKQFLDRAQPDEVIGVHCTHGVNRTGYIVCRYLIEEHDYSFEDAVELFNRARGHNMEKYLLPLKEIWTKKCALRKEHRGLKLKSSKSDDKLRPKSIKRHHPPLSKVVSARFKEAPLEEETLVGLHAEESTQSLENFANDSIDETHLLRFDEDDENEKSTQRSLAR